jgi:hypothetical protein
LEDHYDRRDRLRKMKRYRSAATINDMPRRVFGTLLIVFLSLLSGCIVQSIQPFYTKESVVDLPMILGRWRLETVGGKAAEKQEHPWVFTEKEIDTYDGDKASRISATYFRVRDVVFADVTVAPLPDDREPNMWWTIHVMPVHSLWKVDLSENRLILTPLNYTWIREILARKGSTLSHAPSDDKDLRTLLTGSSEELMAFINKNGAKRATFSAAESYVFERVREKSKDQPANHEN